MRKPNRWFLFALLGALFAAPAGFTPEAHAYVEIPYSLSRIISESTNIILIQVDKVDHEKNTIIYKKVKDLKGTHPGDVIKHTIGHNGFQPREWQWVMQWAEPGQMAVMFHNGAACEVAINNYWYQAYAGDWWNMSHAEPYMLRSFCGKPEKLAIAVQQIIAGQEALVPCMVDGDKNALQVRTARIQRLKVSMKNLDYDAKRDFAGWGVEEFRPIQGMAGFTHYSGLARMDPGAIGVLTQDFDADAKPDIFLFGASRMALLQNGGGSMNDVQLPPAVAGGARAAAWGDFNLDHKPDLLLATPAGPRLLTNLGGSFRDDSGLLPRQGYWNLTSASWIDYDNDGRPDILLADGYQGLRLYRNKSGDTLPEVACNPSGWHIVGPFDNADGKGAERAYPPEQKLDLKGVYDGKGAKAAWRDIALVDHKPNDLRIYKGDAQNDNSVSYLYRTINASQACEMNLWINAEAGSSLWLNGAKTLIGATANKAEPAVIRLALNKGDNTILIKVVHAAGPNSFFYSPQKATPVGLQLFEDVSDKAGLGASGAAGTLKGDDVVVADVNGDHRPDIIYAAGTGVVLLNTPSGFVESKESGITFTAGKVRLAAADYDGDGAVDLFVPQKDGCKLFKNDGKGHFTDVAAKAGLGAIPAGACGLFTDFSNTGRQDLLVGCLKAPNRLFRNDGNGSFTDITEEVGLDHRIFNTRGIAAADLNRDGAPDLVFINEGQESSILLSNPARIAAPKAKDAAASTK